MTDGSQIVRDLSACGNRSRDRQDPSSRPHALRALMAHDDPDLLGGNDRFGGSPSIPGCIPTACYDGWGDFFRR